MILLKNNVITEMWGKEDDELLREFAKSDIYKDYSRDEKVRLALFISFEEPRGLQSTIVYWNQFNKLWDYWCANKFTFIGAN